MSTEEKYATGNKRLKEVTEEDAFHARIYAALMSARGAYGTMLKRIPSGEIPGIPGMITEAKALEKECKIRGWDDLRAWCALWREK